MEQAIASLESAKYGLCFSSGSAATATVLHSLKPGSHLISLSDVYGGTYRYMTRVASEHGVEVSFFGFNNGAKKVSHVEAIRNLYRPEVTKMVWIETPSNPTLSLVDIAEIATVTRELGLILVCDNTFLSPYLCNPLTLGANIVLHSVTKYINGHSDVLMGALAMNDDALYERLKFLQNAIGAVPSPFDCFLAQRGLKTLHLRMRASSHSALTIAKALEASPHVQAVRYPGLESHPQHGLSNKQHRNGMGGGMVSFRIRGGEAAVDRFVTGTQIFTLAESLGGIESLCEVPARMTHASIPKPHREESGVYDNLIRLSCGCEETDDLVRDVLESLEKAVLAEEGYATRSVSETSDE